jgi:hypothetical protein
MPRGAFGMIEPAVGRQTPRCRHKHAYGATCIPPSSGSDTPLMKFAAGLARHKTASATSSGAANRSDPAVQRCRPPLSYPPAPGAGKHARHGPACLARRPTSFLSAMILSETCDHPPPWRRRTHRLVIVHLTLVLPGIRLQRALVMVIMTILSEDGFTEEPCRS